VKLTIQELRTGIYARVVTPGTLQAGNAVVLVARPNPGLTIRALNTCFYHTLDVALAERFIAAEGLMDWWRDRLRARMSDQPS
jgi:MOSC domain-containing protein YiiM